MILAACSKEVAIDSEEKAIYTPETAADEELVTYSFTVGKAEMKSTLTNDGVFSWVVGDKIAIYNSSTSSYVEFEVKSVDGSGNATIQADEAPGATWTNAIYPAARAAGSGNAVDYTVTSVSGPILVSKVVGQTLSFKYLGAVANIRVNDVPGSPTTLTFTANANVFGNRSFDWSGENPVLGGSGSQASITVPFTNNTIISVPIPQVSYAGFTITVDNDGGRHLYKKTTANTFDMSSKKLLPMPELAYVAPSKFYLTTSSESGYWDRENVRMIQTSATDYTIYVNCDGHTTIKVFDNYNLGNASGASFSGSVDDGNYYIINWSTTSGGSVTYKSATVDKPFWNKDYPIETNGMCLSGSFNSWGIGNAFTYNGNMNWVIENLSISGGDHTFKIRKTQSDWAYAAGYNSGLDHTLYGSLKGDNGDAYITLDAGNYNIYLNATSEWYYNIMFEKI